MTEEERSTDLAEIRRRLNIAQPLIQGELRVDVLKLIVHLEREADRLRTALEVAARIAPKSQTIESTSLLVATGFYDKFRLGAPGDPSSPTSVYYRQGWDDACRYIESEIRKLPEVVTPLLQPKNGGRK